MKLFVQTHTHAQSCADPFQSELGAVTAHERSKTDLYLHSHTQQTLPRATICTTVRRCGCFYLWSVCPWIYVCDPALQRNDSGRLIIIGLHQSRKGKDVLD